jgi:hypothetical protein
MSHSPTQTAPQRGTLRWQTQRRLPKPLLLVLRFLMVALRCYLDVRQELAQRR